VVKASAHGELIGRRSAKSAILSALGIIQSVMDFEVRMGGAIRVEFTVTASLFACRGHAMLNGEVKLDEGTSASTADLDRESQRGWRLCQHRPHGDHVRRLSDTIQGRPCSGLNWVMAITSRMRLRKRRHSAAT
jgi:hypothetical protein